MPNQIHTIVTHDRPHLDELIAIWLLRKFGEELFPGVGKAPVVFSRTKSNYYERSAVDLEKEGVLLLGVGHGRFDEHPDNGSLAKEGECCATLVAEALGVRDEVRLQKIFQFVVNNDLKGTFHPFDIAHLAKQLYGRFPDCPECVIDWVSVALEAKYWEQDQFWSFKEEYDSAANKVEIVSGDGVIRLVWMVTESEKSRGFAFSKEGGSQDVFIRQSSSGNVQIFGNPRSAVTLSDVVKVIRLEEQRAGGEIYETDWSVLRQDGTLVCVEEWYYQDEGKMLMNGSLTAPHVPPSKIPFDRLVSLVVTVLSSEFEPVRKDKCLAEVCSSKRNNPCPWWGWGLYRCRKVRSHRYQEPSLTQ